MIRYLLDTNVVSEPARPYPNASVIAKLSEYADELAIAAPVLHELLYGVSRMPVGKRRRRIKKYVRDAVERRLPIIPYDAAAAALHACQRADLQTQGLTPGFVDSQIAAIALAHTLTLVTRNVKDFSNFPGLRLENWFAD